VSLPAAVDVAGPVLRVVAIDDGYSGFLRRGAVLGAKHPAPNRKKQNKQEGLVSCAKTARRATVSTVILSFPAEQTHAEGQHAASILWPTRIKTAANSRRRSQSQQISHLVFEGQGSG
jgi:hypothetical protein